VEGPPDEEFWDRYNKRLEFPLSTVAAVLFHVVVAVGLAYALLALENTEDRSGVPVKLVNLTGLDEVGEGSAGSGGVEDPFVKADGDPLKSAVDSLVDPSKLPEVREQLRNTIKYIDPTGNLPISDANAAAYNNLNEKVREKLLGARQGSGAEKGSGFDGTKGKGPGGTGADSTLGRNMRWVLRFKVSSGHDYLAQLRMMHAEVLVPIPGSEKCVLVQDLDRPDEHKTATDDDMKRLADKIKFSDSRPSAVRDVIAALKLDISPPPSQFWAFFPKDIEDELSRKEKNYRNRQPDSIEETIFRIAVRGGSYEIVVDEQKVKR
jgi:hypothetical protein